MKTKYWYVLFDLTSKEQIDYYFQMTTWLKKKYHHRETMNKCECETIDCQIIKSQKNLGSEMERWRHTVLTLANHES